jgi:hypothetical protein
MAGTNIGQHVSPASEDLPALQRCEALTARRARRIRLLVLTVTASVLAIVAIVLRSPGPDASPSGRHFPPCCHEDIAVREDVDVSRQIQFRDALSDQKFSMVSLVI